MWSRRLANGSEPAKNFQSWNKESQTIIPFVSFISYFYVFRNYFYLPYVHRGSSIILWPPVDCPLVSTVDSTSGQNLSTVAIYLCIALLCLLFDTFTWDDHWRSTGTGFHTSTKVWKSVQLKMKTPALSSSQFIVTLVPVSNNKN